MAAAAHIDHVILGVSDLDEGMRSFREATGVDAPFSGRHPGMGTQNALAALGGGVYLEIIAPRPGAEVGEKWRALPGLEKLTPAGWAIGVDDLDATIRSLRADGFEIGDPQPGSRALPDGSALAWRTADIREPRFEPAPFLIEWGKGATHPSTTSPAGCELVSLRLGSPTPASPKRFVESLGLPVQVEQAAEWSMRLVLDCPKGRSTFDSSK